MDSVSPANVVFNGTVVNICLLQVAACVRAAAAARIAGKPAVFRAARSGDFALVADHLTADLTRAREGDWKNSDETPLHWAAYYGSVGTCDILLQNGARVNVASER